MSVAAAIADPARTRLRIATLDQWADAGMALASRLVAEARRDLAEAVRLLARIAQAVRLATLLATRLSDPTNPAFQPVPGRPRAAPAAEAEPAATERVQAERPDRGRRPGLEREISDDAILRRPLVEIVKVICKTLGIVPDWSLWTEAEDTPVAAPAPSPDPGPETSRSRPRPLVCLQHPLKRPADWPPGAGRLRTRLRISCAPGALIPYFPPIVAWASGRFRLGED